MAVTIKEIAAMCDVSEGTVDRAIHNRPGISERTRERIMNAIKEVNYKPNAVARSLATGNTMTIGIVCFNLENNYFAVLIDVIERVAKSEGYFINLILTHGDPDNEIEGISYLAERHVDGIIIFPVCKGPDYTDSLRKLKVPIVTIYNRISHDFVFVGIDACEVMCEAVKFIARKGYEKILFLNARVTEQLEKGMNVYTLEKRQEGYIRGVRELGLHEPMILEGIDEEKILSAIESCRTQKTAVLCISDNYALSVLEICKRNGIRVPEDLGIMGYDNMDILEYISPRIASVEYDVHALGKTLFYTLFDMIKNDNKAEDCMLSYRFIEGESL